MKGVNWICYGTNFSFSWKVFAGMEYKLIEEIIERSESDVWSNAKLEWSFEYVYVSEEPQRCLCTHYPIKNICVIKNSKNNLITEVGNCCVNKFLGIEDGTRIFTSIKKLKKDDTKSMSMEVLEYLFEKKIINEFEYTFYKDIHRKRKLSDRQLPIKKRINHKLIDFTSSNPNEIVEKINEILKWSESNTWFDTSFIESLKDSHEKRGFLTEKQVIALNNIMTKLKIID